MTTSPRLAVALDGFDDFFKLRRMVDQLNDLPLMFKVRPSLFYRFGAEKLVSIGLYGEKLFFDAKLHDIGNSSLDDFLALQCFYKPPAFITCHTSGSDKMLKGLVDASLQTSTKLIGVTVLTDIDGEECNNTFRRPTLPQVLYLANKGYKQGIRHFVSSPQEVAAIKEQHPDATCITPGIRFPEGEMNDQKRVADPYVATIAGADILVVGRPITGAPDPVSAAQTFIDAYAQGLKVRTETLAKATPYWGRSPKDKIGY